jgi:hypothetical protein
MPVATPRRLPGFAFETYTPVYEDVLPRMDVALFVGFCASGPINVPVPVEDRATFEALFGADAPLAWDAQSGVVAQAQLAPAVRAFFANGGARCWIVRVARDPRSNTFPVPGVAMVGSDGLRPLMLTSRAPGSWADTVSVASSVSARRLALLRWDAPAEPLWLSGPAATSVQAGDVLRVTWTHEEVQAYIAVDSAAPHDADKDGPRRIVVKQADHGSTSLWFDLHREPAQTEGTARLQSRLVPARFVRGDSPSTDAGVVTIELGVTQAEAPMPGAVVPLTFGADEAILTIEDVQISSGPASPAPWPVSIRAKALWARAPYSWSVVSPSQPLQVIVERLTVDLWARTATGDPVRIGNIGMSPSHPRHAARLPDDHTVFGLPDWPDANAALWADAITPRFPLAGLVQPVDTFSDPPAVPFCLPFGVGALPDRFLPAVVDEADAIVRDGLQQFDAALFADAALTDSLTSTLVGDAEYVRFFAQSPRPLSGLHAALPIEEVTLIAVPDAVQPGWSHVAAPPAAITVVSAESCVDDGRFAACTTPACPPVLSAEPKTDAIVLTWVAPDHRGDFVVEHATDGTWSDSATVYDGGGHSVAVVERSPGDHFFRVKGIGDRETQWSNTVVAHVSATSAWRMTTPQAYRSDALLAVHRLLLRVCAARRDVLAVLALPEHYREDAAAAHVALLSSPTAPALSLGDRLVLPIGFGEADALGFAALYHDWSYTRDDSGVLRASPPDGAACGVLARRTLKRGAWIAPANELLNDVVALEQPASPSRWEELQQLQINVVRQVPQGFALMSADTLANDADVRPIGVRRLLMLLRRMAIRLGSSYVFEPNDDSFRRMVQRGFEAMLGTMFERGAFAGATAATAFQVVTDASLNTPASIDQGRFIVELRVAPSRPLTFLTLRLVQIGDRVAVVGA